MKRFDPFPPVSCKHGAPMGRYAGVIDTDAPKLCARHQGGSEGYDKGGAYWGFAAKRMGGMVLWKR